MILSYIKNDYLTWKFFYYCPVPFIKFQNSQMLSLKCLKTGSPGCWLSCNVLYTANRFASLSPRSPLISSRCLHSLPWPKYILSHISSSPLDSRYEGVCVSICRFLHLVHLCMWMRWNMIAFHWGALHHRKNMRTISSSGAMMVTLTPSRAQPCGQLTSFCLHAIGRQLCFSGLHNNANPCFLLLAINRLKAPSRLCIWSILNDSVCQATLGLWIITLWPK